MQPGAGSQVTFDLAGVRARGTAAGWALSGIGAVFVAGGLLDGSGLAVKIVAAVFGGLLLLLGLAVLGTALVTSFGGDRLVVDGAGIRRTSRALGYDVRWDEIGRVAFGLREVGAGYDRYLAGTRSPAPYNALWRWPDSATISRYGVLHFVPRDPVRFAADHPHLDAAAHGRAAFVGAPFGQVLDGQRDDLDAIGNAIAHFSGPLFSADPGSGR